MINMRRQPQADKHTLYTVQYMYSIISLTVSGSFEVRSFSSEWSVMMLSSPSCDVVNLRSIMEYEKISITRSRTTVMMAVTEEGPKAESVWQHGKRSMRGATYPELAFLTRSPEVLRFGSNDSLMDSKGLVATHNCKICVFVVVN